MNKPLGKVFSFFHESLVTFKAREHRLSLTAIFLAALFILACWAAVYLLDVRHIFGLRSTRGFWWHLFKNRGPVEFAQWGFLALTVLFSAALSGFHYARNEKRACTFWALIAVTFVLMLIEDAGDPRHMLSGYASTYLGIKKRDVEGVFYIFISFPLVYAFLRYWRIPFVFAHTRIYLLLGAFFYGLAATTSVFRHQGDFYLNLGDRLSSMLLEGVVPGFFLMDFVIEEAVELMGAATFFAGVLIYWRLVIQLSGTK